MQFTASQELSFTRSTFFKLAETESQSNVWSIKPPDFSLKLYRCMSGSQKKEGKTKTKLTVPQCGETKRRTGIFLPNVVHVNPERKDPPKFITSYRALDALESELMFVKTGKYNSGPYKNPKPHNFRPTRSETDFNCRATKTQMNTYKPPEPKWDPKLILPPLPWPPKSASFTRHRRRRGAYSAFLDRVE
uniref:Si:dkey-30e9.6 n=1 Tax=Acanthochromis polyacanthus TaxID=80966 RepID=A0A3Q1EU68_9TELE